MEMSQMLKEWECKENDRETQQRQRRGLQSFIEDNRTILWDYKEYQRGRRNTRIHREIQQRNWHQIYEVTHNKN